VSALALTFDDGPSEWTAPILDELARHGAKATFFVLGEHVDGNEDVLRRAVAEGHELGNHTFSHTPCSRLSADEIETELTRTQELIAAATGVRPRLVRPPYGDGFDAVEPVAQQLGFARTVLWTQLANDWEEGPAAEIVERLLAGAAPGAILLLHDGFPSRKDSQFHNTREPTVEAVRVAVPALVADGYELVTVSTLLGA